MRDLRLLVGLELRARYGFGRYRHVRDGRERRRGMLLGVVGAVIAVVMAGYVAGYAYLLCSLGQGATVPSLLGAVAAILVVAVGLFRAGEMIFGARGYELLVSMPLRAWALPLARLTVLYVEDLVLTLGVLVPGLAVYAVMVQPGTLAYASMAGGALVLPMLPLGVALLLGTLVTAVTANLKHKSLVGSVLMVAFVLAVVLGSTVLLPMGLIGNVDELTPERLGVMLATVAGTLGGVYPPAGWFGNAVTGSEGGLTALGLLAGVSVGILSAVAAVVVALFHTLVRRLSATAATHDYRLGKVAHRSLLRALYVREGQRYFASSIYVTNTILGPILGAVLSVVLLVVGADTVRAALAGVVDLGRLLPVAIGMVFCLMNTTSVSVSMEGRGMELIRSMPIPKKPWLDAKLLWNLTLMLPCWVVAAVCLTVASRPTVGDFVWLMVFPPLLMLFSTTWGLTVDLRFHRFDREDEVAIVKQSLSAMLGGFAGPLCALLCAGILLVVPGGLAWVAEAGICAALAVATGVLYRHNVRGEIVDLSGDRCTTI